MLGRSKELTKWRASCRSRRSAISRWVGGSAVAVSAIRGICGQRSCSTVSWRYSGRKSWPHCDTQWASSMANRAIWLRDSSDRKRPVSSRSGRHRACPARRPAARVRRGRRSRHPGGIQVLGTNAELAQGFDLVLHQRDQRRDDDATSVTQQGRHLVAQRLATAGGHQHQGIVTGSDMLHDVLLRTTEIVVTKDALKQVVRGTGSHPASLPRRGVGRAAPCTRCKPVQRQRQQPALG